MQRAGNLLNDLQRDAHRRGAVADQRRRVHARHVLHHDGPARLQANQIVHAHDRPVVQQAEDAGLVAQPVRDLELPLVVEHLQRDLLGEATAAEQLCAIDDSETTLSEGLEDAVSADFAHQATPTAMPVPSATRPAPAATPDQMLARSRSASRSSRAVAVSR